MNQHAVLKRDPSRLPLWLQHDLPVLVPRGTLRKWLVAAAPLFGGCLFGASFLLASVPSQPAPKRSKPIPSPVREQFTPPMARLLDDMNRASRPALPLIPSLAARLTGPIAAPFFFASASTDRDRAQTCLATAGWYEAGDDPAGQRAVMQVVLNRVRHPSFPKSVCAVVFQGAERQTGCQFSFTCDGSMRRRLPSAAAWAQARALAAGALSGAVDPDVRQATHFHADYVSPWWAPKLDPIVKIGAHIFYRWGGARGALGPASAPMAREVFPVLAGAKNAYIAPPVAADLGHDFLSPAAEQAKGPQARSATEADLAAVKQAAVTAPAAGPQNLVMRVDQGGPSGRWALSAMGLCASAGPCRVVAAEDGALEHASSPHARPLFLFARDAAGMQIALWDCDRAPRPRADQCLPSGAELDALLD